MNKKNGFVIWISLRFILKSLVDNMWALVQVMAWRRTGYKPLSEPMLTQLTDAYLRHYAEMS